MIGIDWQTIMIGLRNEISTLSFHVVHYLMFLDRVGENSTLHVKYVKC
jgi:hypothetical protein